MRFVSAWLSYFGHVLIGTVCVLAVAIIVGYFPFSSDPGSGWDGWLVGEKIARLSMLAIAGRSLVLPVLVFGLAVGTLDALAGPANRRGQWYRAVLVVVAVLATYVATRVVPGTASVTPNVQIIALVSAIVFAANHGRVSRDPKS